MSDFCSKCHRSLYPFEKSQDYTMCAGCRMHEIKMKKEKEGTWIK